MRKSMNMVELLRFFQASQVIARSRYEGKSSLTLDDVTDLLGNAIRKEEGWWKQLSTRRVKEIIKTLQECGLCKVERNIVNYGITFNEKWDELQQALTEDLAKSPREEWWKTHKFLQINHPVFSRFYNIAKKTRWIDPVLMAKHLGLKYSIGKIHPTVSVLIEWELKLGRFQRNALTGDTYVLMEPTLINYQVKQKFVDNLCKAYNKVKEEEKEFAASLPKVQEYVCQNLQITRLKFNLLLEELYLENLGSIFLESGIIPSYAYDKFGGQRRKQVLKLDALPQKLWFDSTFSYIRKDWEDIVINNEVKRFICIDDDFLGRFIDA